jgi:cytochrome P450
LKTIYGSRKVNVQKANWYRTIDAGSKAFSTHSEIDKDRHAFRRRVLDQAFSDAALGPAEDLILKDVRNWVLCLGDDSSVTDIENVKTRDMKDWCNWLSFDIMGDLTFGKNFGCVEGRYRYVPEVVLNSTKFVHVVSQALPAFELLTNLLQAGFLPCISWLRPLLRTSWTSFSFAQNAKQNEAYVKYANSLMEDRMAKQKKPAALDKPTSRNDFMHYLLHARDPETGQGLSVHELNADSALLIHAGSDTVRYPVGELTMFDA